MGTFARQELEQAGFPAATNELALAIPIEDLVGNAGEFDLEVRVSGVDGQARMSVGYLPGGPVTAGQQTIGDGESRVLRKQLAKPGSVLVVALDQPGRVDVNVAGARGFDDDAQEAALAGEDDVDEMPLGFETSEHGDVGGGSAAGAAKGAGNITVAGAIKDALGIKPATPPAPSSAESAAIMDKALQQLEALYLEAKTKRLTSLLLLTGQNVDELLADRRNELDYLAGEGRRRVLAGEAPLSSGDPDRPAWLEAADSAGKAIQLVAGYTDRWDLSSTIATAAPDFANAAKDVGRGSVDLVNGLVSLGVLYLLWKIFR